MEPRAIENKPEARKNVFQKLSNAGNTVSESFINK
jgi:hypothetical protein